MPPPYSLYPSQIDNSSSLPLSTDKVTEVKAEVVNRLRDAILNIENELGINPSDIYGTVKARLDALMLSINELKSDVQDINSKIQIIEAAISAIQADVAALQLAIINANLSLYNCDAGLPNKGFVTWSNIDEVALASASSASTKTFGWIYSRPTSTTVLIQSIGEINNLIGLTPGEVYVLSESPGEFVLASSPPLTLSSIIQIVGFAKNSTTLSLTISPNFIIN